MTPSFVDDAHRAALAEHGFVVVPGLYADVVPQLRDAYEAMIAGLPRSDSYFACPMTGTNFLDDRARRRDTIARVSAIIGPRLEPVLRDYRFVGASFRVKQTGPDSLLCLHQDPTMVDEDHQWSLNIMVPLIDTHADNGALRVVPGSHRYLPKVRCMGHTDRYDFDQRRIDDEVGDLLQLLPMRAGDALFHVNALLHGSGPNVTDQHRPIVLGTIMSKGSSMVLYRRKAEAPSVVERFEVPDDFFATLENFERDFKLRPKNGRQLSDVTSDDVLSRDQLLALLRAGTAALGDGR